MSSPEVDRNLLLGVLALQMEFIDKDALVAAMHAWVLEKSKSLGKILCEQGRLTEGDYHALVALVERHVERHRGDARQGLVSLRLIGAVPREIDQFPDEVIQATLAPMRASAPMHPSKITTLPPAPRPGSSNERFEILRPHAWGGLGEVCLARDKELNREVALKRILERHAGDADSCARFLQEAEITGSLEHPGIVPVYALGTDGDGRPFYAMRFIRGETLKDAIERFHSDTTKSESDRRIELRQLLQRFLAVCNALEYAHSRGVIHRDLKPSNIMLDKYGETLVVDWGLAKALGQRSEGAAAAEVTLIPSSGSGVSATQAGSAIGTPVFMSPEQAAGRLDAIGPQSDVYSLGATLYVLLAGKEPFDGMVGIVLAKVQDGLFIPPKAIKPTVPSALNAICLKAMSRNPQDRHASCADLGRDVERWLADEPVSAFRDPFSVRVVRWIRRHRALTAGSAALATALLLALSVGTIVLGRANTQIRHANDEIKAKSDEKERQRTEAERQRDEAERLRKLTMRQLYVAQMNAAARAWDEHSAGRTLELLEAERPELTDGVDLRGWEWHRLWRLSHSELHMLDSPMVSLAVTGDGQQILGSDWNGRLQIRSAIDLHEIRTIEAHERRFDRIQLSADGKLVATSGDDSKVKLWDFATWKVLREFPGTHFVRYGMSLSRDGSRIAIASDDVHLYSTNDGKELARLSTGMQQVTALAFAPDGKSVFSASSENGNVVTMWDVATAKSVRTYTGHRATIRTLAISPDGHVVVSGSNDGEIRAWDVKAGKPLVAFRPHEAIVTSLTFREDGRRLVSTSNDTTIKIWDVETWHEVQTLRGHFQSVIDAIYTQSGNALVSTSFDETVRNWDAASRQEPWTDRSAGSPIFTVVYSSDGRYLAAGSSCFTAVWDAASGLKLWEERDPVERIPEWDADERFSSRVLCFDPQSQLLARGLTNGNVRILEAKTGKLRSAWRAANGPIWSVAFTANGRKLGTTGGETPQLSLWNPNDGAPVNFRAKLPRIVVGILSIPSHDQIATWGIAENANVSLFDISTDRMVQKFEAAIHLPYCAAASPDGRQIVIGGRAQSLEWLDIETGQRRQILRPHAGSILGLAFSPDCRRLASSSADCSVKIWDAESRQEVLTIKPDDTRATCIVFSPDGTRLAACTESGTVWVWDARPLTPKLRADILAADVTNRDLKSKPQPAN